MTKEQAYDYCVHNNLICISVHKFDELELVEETDTVHYSNGDMSFDKIELKNLEDNTLVKLVDEYMNLQSDLRTV